MARILVTGSADGLGRGAAVELLDAGHEVVVHARSPERARALDDLAGRGAAVLVGDLADTGETRALAAAANRLGPMDAVIHNAGVSSKAGPALPAVNVVAPYLLTALLERRARLVYLSSERHYKGTVDAARLATVDWTGRDDRIGYGDSKLMVTALAAAVARLWPGVPSNSVDPGWVPTRMGGPNATDDLREGHLTQTWLAASDDPEARSTGGYWHHRRRLDPHPTAGDEGFQGALLASLEEYTDVPLR